MAYNQSKVKLYRRCQKAYSFRYDYAAKYGIEGKSEMIPSVTKAPLYRGSWMHLLQEVHHKLWAGVEGVEIEVPHGRGKRQVEVETWQEAHEAMVEHYDSLFEEEKDELGDMPGDCYRLFNAYLGFYGDDDKRYKPLLSDDGEPCAEMILEVPLDRWGIQEPFKGTIDLLVEDLEYGGVWIWDAKWVKKVPSQDERMMSPQALLYVWALRRLGYDIRGFVFNYGRTKAPVIPTVLKRGTLSQRKNMDTNYETYLEAIMQLHQDRWKEYAETVYSDFLEMLKEKDVLWFRRERIPVETDRIKRALAEFIVSCKDIERRNKKYPPRTYTYSCKFGCEYHDLCVAEFNGLDITPLVKAGFTFTEERYESNEDLLAT